MRYQYIFLLVHSYKVGTDENCDDIVETKRLGLYSCKKAAIHAQERFKVLAGFRDHPNDFFVQKRRIELDDKNTRLLPGVPIFHLRNEWTQTDYDIVTDLGFFIDIASAEETINQLISQKKRRKDFLNIRDNYVIGEFILDVDNSFWTDGFLDGNIN